MCMSVCTELNWLVPQVSLHWHTAVGLLVSIHAGHFLILGASLHFSSNILYH